MNLQESLTDLGLTKNEAQVYTSLLSLGLTQAGPIIKKVKLHRMLVYNALESLIDRGLATVVQKKNVKLFQAGDPTVLLERTEHLRALAKTLLPDLKKLQAQQTEVINVRTLIGHEGLATSLTQIIESAARQKDKTMRIIGGALDAAAYEAFGEWYPTYLQLLEQNKVRKLLVSPTNYSNMFRKKFLNEGNTEMRTLKEGLTSPTYTRITEEMISIEMYKPQIVTIQIFNKVIAQAHMDSFELLWKSANRTT
jgi:sugar-specific transcriptional regulator TrmB